ncbi:MAG: ribose-phosphate pyrophosphokinase [Gammaproteobacteria bacterium]|nr:ribose-phosphate pyrophosphokinase [Gammaproteobacteria bacterium]
MHRKLRLFTGNANPELAAAIADKLNIPIGNAKVDKFSDGEIMIEINENVRGADVFIIQSTSHPTNDSLMELVFLADALRRASANTITAVMPYFGYARQDRRVRSARVPISAKVIADMLTAVGVSRILTVDLHADQIQGFFYIPVDNVFASPVLLDDMLKMAYKNIKVVSPDVGGVVRARAFAKRLNDSELAIIDKRRSGPNESQVMNIIGDIQDRDCIIVDDIVDTAGTLCSAAKALKDKGANRVLAYCTHPVLSGPAIERISKSVLDEVVVTDTIGLTADAKQCPKIRSVSMADILAEAIHRISEAESLSLMFPD